ncbi:MAG: hypothetical protein HFE51_02170 [Clostridia bacterium]|nr:hypothetical protein [Clostridia bacterium]MCI9085210.1 hypothetical protein [Clostridia bacterium]NDO19878.1 hypothetical protein [Lachnospiraceae bacterium MD329]
MRNITKVVAAVSLITLLTVNTGIVFADDDISVRMDGVISEGSDYVPFDDVKPIQLDSRTLIPARAMAEAAGMEVTWDQPTQTAILTLTPNADSDKPIERFAAEAISKVNGFGLEMTPKNITAALRINSSRAVIRYNFTDSEGDNVSIGKPYEMVSQAVLINGGTLMVPVRDSMEMFGLNVGWTQETLCAFVSMPETVAEPDGIAIISNHGEGEYAANQSGEAMPVVGEYIGRFKITHYCPCEICNGGWGARTAWAGEMNPGQTIAVNTNVIPPLANVYIDGYGYRIAEDTGSGLEEYQIDVAVPTHDMAMALGVVYRDVYYAE